MMRRAALLATFLVAGCSSSNGGGGGTVTDDDPPVSDSDDGVDTTCKTQRVVDIVGGNGGLALFTLLWPVPDIIEQVRASDAYDDRSLATHVVTDAAHPLYARNSVVPDMTVLTGYANQAHTGSPKNLFIDGTSVIGAAVHAQAATLAARVPVMVLGGNAIYTPVEGGPAGVSAGTLNDAFAALEAAGATVDAGFRAEVDVRVEAWVGDVNAISGAMRSFARWLAFTSIAFERNDVGTVIVTALNVDPHNAFDDGSITATANVLTRVMAGFTAQLAATNETTCGDGAVTLERNTLIAIEGDTPKHSWTRTNWPDGGPADSWVYVRSNGFLRPGWFGEPLSTGLMTYDPSTGNLSSQSKETLRRAGSLATLHAILRGDSDAVAALSTASYQGLVP